MGDRQIRILIQVSKAYKPFLGFHNSFKGRVKCIQRQGQKVIGYAAKSILRPSAVGSRYEVKTPNTIKRDSVDGSENSLHNYTR